MKRLPLAGVVALAGLGAHAQVPVVPTAPQTLDNVVVTAIRSPQAQDQALRDVTVISRGDIEAAGSLSLAELLQRFALVEFRATGGPGQPTGLFLRGANAAQTLVLVDGLRVNSATVGTTSVENIPLDMIERIEVVKGPLSSLYGSDAIGGVIQVFTRAGGKPRFFASAGFGSDRDERASAGFRTSDADTAISFAMGGRRVDAPSATNARNFCFDPDRDPYDNAFANLQASYKLRPEEVIALTAFVTRGRTHFDGCPDDQGRTFDDRNIQTISGARLSSSMFFAPWWSSRLVVGQGRDKLEIEGSSPSRFETRQDQAGWINEFGTQVGTVMAGLETVRQSIASDTVFSTTRRNTNSGFLALNETWQGQRLEASIRRDQDDQFGDRNTGSVSYGAPWPGVALLSFTYGRGFRAPTFFDLYAPSSKFYVANPGLRPEKSTSRELSLRSDAKSNLHWRLTGFDNRIADLITYVFPTVVNVNRARIRGVEASVDAAWLGVRWRASLAAQRPRDEDTGKALQGRAQRFGTFEGSYGRQEWSVAAGVTASGERFDSTDESRASRLPGYATLFARATWRIDRKWALDVTAANLLDKRYESAVGYDAPRRGVFLNLRFDTN